MAKKYIPTGGRAIPGTPVPGTRAPASTGGILPQEAPVSGTGGDQGILRANLALQGAQSGAGTTINSQPVVNRSGPKSVRRVR
jgi:hypothetical protein